MSRFSIRRSRYVAFFLGSLIVYGCSNPPAPVEVAAPKKKTAKPVSPPAKPAASPWKVGSYAAKEGETEGRKYVRLVTEGTYSDSTGSEKVLFAEVIVNKSNAGILLHKLKKSAPVEKFSGPVQIRLTNSSGEELDMTSTRGWNSTGGTLIERNNNDYSRFRIFLLQNTGILKAEMRDSRSSVYVFSINLDGFGEAFPGI